MLKRHLLIISLLSLTASVLAPALVYVPVNATAQPSFINGKMAYVDMQPGKNIIWTRNGDGSNPVKLYESSALLGTPSWSPNGKQLIFYEGSGDKDIYKINADGTGKVNLTNVAGRDESASWSPDGNKIAFVSDRGRATADYRLHLMNADGTNQVDISDGASEGDRFTAWSPDSTKVYYNSFRSGSEQLYAYSTATQTHSQFTSLPSSAIEPSVSPDGSKVVFAHAGAGDTKIHLYVQNTDGSGFKKLFGLCSDNYSQWPLWSPDGRKIIFISECNTEPKTKVYMINADGTEPQLISDEAEDTWGTMGWHRVPVAGIVVDPSTGIIKVDQNGNNSDTDYEVHKNHELFIAGNSGNVIVHGEGVLKGTGATGKVTVEDKGRIAPGSSPGCLATGDLIMNTGSTLDQELGGTTACSEYDRINVTGAVTLGNSTLNIILYDGYAPSNGTSFTIISNDGTDAVTGTFNGLPEGGEVAVAGVTYKISYLGGDGNDVVLSVIGGAASFVPGAPDTGMRLMLTNPAVILGSSTIAAATLLIISRKLKTLSRE